jgi:hypothetical protein
MMGRNWKYRCKTTKWHTRLSFKYTKRVSRPVLSWVVISLWPHQPTRVLDLHTSLFACIIFFWTFGRSSLSLVLRSKADFWLAWGRYNILYYTWYWACPALVWSWHYLISLPRRYGYEAGLTSCLVMVRVY